MTTLPYLWSSRRSVVNDNVSHRKNHLFLSLTYIREIHEKLKTVLTILILKFTIRFEKKKTPVYEI